MHKLPLVLAALAVAAAVSPAGQAARVHVRVEGKMQTLYGGAEPRLEAGATALSALDAASLRGEFYYHLTETSFGSYVDQIGRFPAAGSSGWVFKVNGESPPVGADQVRLRTGDRVLWYWATFSDAGGPTTLRLLRRKDGCYRVLAENDAGKATVAAGAVLTVDGRRTRVRGPRTCIGPHRGLVRAVRAGSVRSNAVR